MELKSLNIFEVIYTKCSLFLISLKRQSVIEAVHFHIWQQQWKWCCECQWGSDSASLTQAE